MEHLKTELEKRFGADGNGKLLKKNSFGQDLKPVTVEAFEAWSGESLENRKGNEYGTEDAVVILIDEQGDDFELTLEIEKEIITHSYY